MKTTILILSLALAAPAAASPVTCKTDIREVSTNSPLYTAVNRAVKKITHFKSHNIQIVGRIFNVFAIQNCTNNRSNFQGVAVHFRIHAAVHNQLTTFNCLSKQKRFRTADGAWGRWLSSATRCAFINSHSSGLGPIHDDADIPSDNGGSYDPDDTYDPDYNRRIPNYGNVDSPDYPGYTNEDSHIPSDNGNYDSGTDPGYSGDEWH